MRLVIKNADFSSVSIGKVEKDLSFSYEGEAVNGILDNPIDDWSWVTSNGVSPGNGHNGPTDFYMASSGDTEFTPYLNNENRLTTELFEVSQGMVLTAFLKDGYSLPSNLPVIICYNQNHELLSPAYASWNSPFTVPAGVKYIKFQFGIITTTIKVTGTVPLT